MRKKNGYWTYETCMEESRKYTTRSEFAKRSSGPYKLSCKNGWIDEYTWFEDGNKIAAKNRTKWTYETCMEESRKYTTRSEFQRGNGGAYSVARKNGWLDEFTWLELQCKPRGYWTYETCVEESHKYTSRSEFQMGSVGAYEVALKNGWLNDFFPK